MSEITELAAVLRREADERDRAPEHFDQALTGAMRAAASVLGRLERERDEQRVMFLYEADKHSEWLEKFMDMKRRAEAAEAREKRLTGGAGAVQHGCRWCVYPQLQRQRRSVLQAGNSVT